MRAVTEKVRIHKVSGMADGVSVVIRHTLVQTMPPDYLRGRISSVNNVFIQSSNKLGEFESGVVAAWLGAGPSVMVGGLATMAIVGVVAWGVPALRRLGPLQALSLPKVS